MFAKLLLVAAFQVGPFYEQKTDYAAIRPFYSHDVEVTDVVWPVFTKHRDWWRFCYVLNAYERDDGQSQFTIFPFWWHGNDRRSGSYAGLFPVWGKHPHVAFLYDFEFALWPLWMRYRMPRPSKNEWMTTDAFLFPFFHVRSDGSWGVWPLCGLGKQRESEHRYICWPFFTWANYRQDRDTAGEGVSSMIWPICASVSRERELQVLVVPPFFSYARTDSTTRWRMPWPLVEVERGARRNRISVFPFYEKVDDFDYADKRRVNGVTRFGWRLVELYDDESRIFPFWSKGRGHFRLWPFWECEENADGEVRGKALALFPIRHVPAVDRNWSKFWTFFEYGKTRDRAEYSLFWGLIRW